MRILFPSCRETLVQQPPLLCANMLYVHTAARIQSWNLSVQASKVSQAEKKTYDVICSAILYILMECRGRVRHKRAAAGWWNISGFLKCKSANGTFCVPPPPTLPPPRSPRRRYSISWVRAFRPAYKWLKPSLVLGDTAAVEKRSRRQQKESPQREKEWKEWRRRESKKRGRQRLGSGKSGKRTSGRKQEGGGAKREGCWVNDED